MKPTKRLLKISIPIIVIVCTIIFTPWKVVVLWMTPLPDRVQEQVNDAVDQGLDGIIVYLDGGGRAPELYAAGWNDRARKVPADPNVLFKIASISRLYIYASVAKMVYNKTLSLDRTLAEYLPKLAERIEYADQITLRMMLQHRSGIPDYIDSPDLPWTNFPEEASGLKPCFNLFSYCNSAYILA